VFSAGPAPLARIAQQLALDGRWANGPRVAFSVPNYMSDFGGAAATSLYDSYRSWAARCVAAR